MCNSSIYFYIIYKVKKQKIYIQLFFLFFRYIYFTFFVLLLATVVDQIGNGGVANIDCVKLSEVVASQTSLGDVSLVLVFLLAKCHFYLHRSKNLWVLAVGLAMAIRLVILRRLLHSVVEGVECLLVHTLYTVHTIDKKYFNLFLLQLISYCRF